MNEINSAEKIFLGKLETLLLKFNELDNIMDDIEILTEEHPEKQRQLDLLLSDYYHRLEADALEDKELVNIGKKIHDVRIERRNENKVGSLIACFEKHKNKLSYTNKENREMFRHNIKMTLKNYNNDYKYRILTDNDIKQLSKSDEKVIKNEETSKRKYGKAPTKKELQKSIKQGMKNKDISEKFDITLTYVSKLKRKYGLNKRK